MKCDYLQCDKTEEFTQAVGFCSLNSLKQWGFAASRRTCKLGFRSRFAASEEVVFLPSSGDHQPVSW